MNAEVKKTYSKGFTTVGNTAFSAGLSLKARGLLCTMLSLPKDWNYSIEGLVKLVGADGQGSVRAALKELKDKGYVLIEQVRDKGKIIGTHWVISDTPMTGNASFKSAESDVKKPHVEKSHVENTRQLNKQEQNKQKQNKYTPYIPQRGNVGTAVEKSSAEERKTKKQERQEKRVQDMQTVQGLFSLYSSGEKETVQRLNEWLELRCAKKAPFSVVSIKKNLEQLDSAAKQSGLDVNSYLDQVIMRGWSGFFPLPVKQSQHQTAGLPVWQIKQPESEEYFDTPKTLNRMMVRRKPLVFRAEEC